MNNFERNRCIMCRKMYLKEAVPGDEGTCGFTCRMNKENLILSTQAVIMRIQAKSRELYDVQNTKNSKPATRR